MKTNIIIALLAVIVALLAKPQLEAYLEAQRQEELARAQAIAEFESEYPTFQTRTITLPRPPQ